jgi:hypothetical protein
MFTDMDIQDSLFYNNSATKGTKGIFSGFGDVYIRDTYFGNIEHEKETAL